MLLKGKKMKRTDYDLETVTVKKDDTVKIEFNTDGGFVTMQINKESLLTHIAEWGLDCDLETFLSENLRDVVKSYLEENL